MNKIAIVILNYNSFEDTIKLVCELQMQTVSKLMQIVVVDNFSPNNSFYQLTFLERKYSNVKILQTGSNLGYAKGNNFGLEYLDNNVHPEFIAILNNDVKLEYDCFENLIRKYWLLDEPAVIAPRQLDNDAKEVLGMKMNTFLEDCLRLFYIYRFFLNYSAKVNLDTTGKIALDVELVPGCFMFSSFDRFKNLGFFNSNTFLYVEERFITVEVQKKGWKNYIILDQFYSHSHSKTINSVYDKSARYKIYYKSLLVFTRMCRSNGEIKAKFLQFLMFISLIEIKFLCIIKNSLSDEYSKC